MGQALSGEAVQEQAEVQEWVDLAGEEWTVPEPPPQGGPVPSPLGIRITAFFKYWFELWAIGTGHWSNARGDSVDL